MIGPADPDPGLVNSLSASHCAEAVVLGLHEVFFAGTSFMFLEHESIILCSCFAQLSL